MSLLRRIEGGGGSADANGGGASPEGRVRAVLDELAEPRRGGGVVTPPGQRDTGWSDLLRRVQNKVISELDPKLDLSKTDQVKKMIEDVFHQVLETEGIALPRTERQRLYEAVIADILGFGPIEPLLQDATVSEIMVNGPYKVFVEQKGKLRLTNVKFDDNAHVMRIIDRIISPLGRRCDESSPMVDARLPDGSRVNAVIPPIAIDGPIVTIRKFSKNKLSADDLIRFGTITPEMAQFLKACVEVRLNIIVAGGTGSGKTTLLNVLSTFIPDDERIITVEDAAELQLQQEHVVRLEARPANIEGKGRVSIRDLVINTLRMRPERIVVGECRGAETVDMLTAMNTGHDGSLTTAHANTPRDTISRLETMYMMAGMDIPVKAIREQIASAVDLVVQQARLKDGSRKVINITEVQGMEGDVIIMQDIFVFEQTGYEGGKVQGRLKPTGIRPKFAEKFEEYGVRLPHSVFGATSSLF